MQGLWPQNLAGFWIMVRQNNLRIHIIFWLRGHVCSGDKLKA